MTQETIKQGWQPQYWPGRVAQGWRAVWHNPLVAKELRGRLRDWHGLFDLAVCTGVLVVVGLVSYSSGQFSSRLYSYQNSGAAARNSQEAGTGYVINIVVAQVILLALVGARLGGAALAGEKEEQTYDVLLVTLLRPRDIVIGKLTANMAYLLLIAVAGLPVAGVAFLIGGLDFDQLVAGWLIIGLTALVLAAVGVFWSGRSASIKAANRNCFLNIVFGWLVLPFGCVYVLNGSFGLNGIPLVSHGLVSEIAIWIMSLNPVYAVIATGKIVQNQIDHNLLFYQIGSSSWLIMPFFRFLIVNIIVSVIYGWLAVRQVRPGSYETPKQAALRAIKKRLGRDA